MEKLIEKNKLIMLIALLISEIFCFWITKISLISYDNQSIYHFSINIIQGLYFLAVLIVSLYILFSNQNHKTLLINSTIGLILYSIILHFNISSSTYIFIRTQGIVNFVKYASKIYFICLPLISFRILLLKHAKSTLLFNILIFLRIIILITITFILNYFLKLNGILYAVPLSEFINFIISIIFVFKKKGMENRDC